MEKFENKIVFNDIKPDRHDVRVLQRQLDNWIEQHAKINDQAPALSEMIIDYDGPHHYICRAFVKAGEHEWVGQDTGRSPQDAASKTLKHLHEKRFITAH